MSITGRRGDALRDLCKLRERTAFAVPLARASGTAPAASTCTRTPASPSTWPRRATPTASGASWRPASATHTRPRAAWSAGSAASARRGRLRLRRGLCSRRRGRQLHLRGLSAQHLRGARGLHAVRRRRAERAREHLRGRLPLPAVQLLLRRAVSALALRPPLPGRVRPGHACVRAVRGRQGQGPRVRGRQHQPLRALRRRHLPGAPWRRRLLSLHALPLAPDHQQPRRRRLPLPARLLP